MRQLSQLDQHATDLQGFNALAQNMFMYVLLRAITCCNIANANGLWILGYYQ